MRRVRIKSSGYLTLSQAAKTVPGRPHASSLWRWYAKGVKTPDGFRVKLRARRFGRNVYTTKEWLKEFGDELAAADQRAGESGNNSRRVQIRHDKKDQIDEVTLANAGI